MSAKRHETTGLAPAITVYVPCAQVWCTGAVEVVLCPGPAGNERCRWLAHVQAWTIDCPACLARRAANPTSPLEPLGLGLPGYLVGLVGSGEYALAEEQLILLAEADPGRAARCLDELRGGRWKHLPPHARKRWARLAAHLGSRRVA